MCLCCPHIRYGCVGKVGRASVLLGHLGTARHNGGAPQCPLLLVLHLVISLLTVVVTCCHISLCHATKPHPWVTSYPSFELEAMDMTYFLCGGWGWEVGEGSPLVFFATFDSTTLELTSSMALVFFHRFYSYVNTVRVSTALDFGHDTYVLYNMILAIQALLLFSIAHRCRHVDSTTQCPSSSLAAHR
jgi:hypothetical protein